MNTIEYMYGDFLSLPPFILNSPSETMVSRMDIIFWTLQWGVFNMRGWD